jgi:hypothetical protein
MKLAMTLLAFFLVNGDPEMKSNTLPFGPPGEDPCGAQPLQHLVGHPVPDAESLEALEGPARIRVIRPGQAVTMDHVPSRLNIELDENDIVVRLRCG